MKQSRAQQENNNKNVARLVPTYTSEQDRSRSREDSGRGKKPQQGQEEVGTGNRAHPRPDSPQAS